jgi:transcriptional regulator with XRE-family HTH domain
VAPQSPAVAQLELTARLRKRRAERGLSVQTVSRHLGFSPNYWSGVENGRTILAEGKLIKLAGLLEFDEAETMDLVELRTVAKGPRWWTNEFANVIDERLAQYYGLEYGASLVRSFESSIVPGLLQTEEYARALISADPDTNETRVRKYVELRLRRQRRLHEDPPLRLFAVVNQAALMQQIGGPGVLRRQLLHLLESAAKLEGSFELRVIPFTATPQGLLNIATMHFLDFPSSHLPTVAWREAVEPVGIDEEPDTLDLLLVGYDKAITSALSREDSLVLLRSLVDGWSDSS